MQEAPNVVVERLIKAPPARIYKAMTDAAKLKKWFFTDATTDPRPGGRYSMTWRSILDSSRDHERVGRYLELVPNEKIVFEWQGDWMDGSGPMPDTVVSITLTPKSGGTLVRLVHAGWPATPRELDLRNKHEGGWTFYLENLDGYLNGGTDQRKAQHNQLVRT